MCWLGRRNKTSAIPEELFGKFRSVPRLTADRIPLAGDNSPLACYRFSSPVRLSVVRCCLTPFILTAPVASFLFLSLFFD